MPPATATSRPRQASSAKRSGGTTKQQDRLTNGRARHAGLAAGDEMQDLEAGVQRVAAAEAGADMLGRAGDAGVERVEVELHGADHVARHEAALEEVDVVERVDDPRGVVEVLQQRLAIVAGLEVDHVHGGAGGAEMHLAAPRLEVVARVLAAEREAAGGAGDDVLDQRPREAQAAVLVDEGAARGAGLDAGGQRLRHADPLQHVERRRWMVAMSASLSGR